MVGDLLMAAVTDPAGDTEAEAIVVLLNDDGRMRFKLDDGRRLEFDYDELLAIAGEEQPCAAAAHERAA